MLKGISTAVTLPRNKWSLQKCSNLQRILHISKLFTLQSSKVMSNVATSKHVDASSDDIAAKHIVEWCGVLAFKAASDDKGDQAHTIYIF